MELFGWICLVPVDETEQAPLKVEEAKWKIALSGTWQLKAASWTARAGGSESGSGSEIQHLARLERASTWPTPPKVI